MTTTTPTTGTAAFMLWLLTNDPQAHRAILFRAYAAARADGDSFEAFAAARAALVRDAMAAQVIWGHGGDVEARG